LHGRRGTGSESLSTPIHGEAVNRGQLIAFEGLDGCGKSTQIERLAAALEASGCSVVLTREPTDGEFGRRIRAAALSGEEISPDEELRWFVEDRRAHVAQVIQPALRAGKTVLSDRYYLSSVAYQGARGCDPTRILEESEAEFPIPDLVVLLVIDASAGLARVRARGNAVETRFERSGFLEAVAEIFQRLDRPYIARIAAAGTPDEVQQAVAECVGERLGLP
jgi:dTMP kinase